MATKGLALEKLVEHLEKLDMGGAVIKTRDKIFDKVAREIREIDVSVKFRTGSHDFLIIFECRDRKRKNGPDWIEQIAQKTKDIGANKVVAVSSSGFTRSAIEKAKHHNIILRTVEEISSKEISDWFLPKSFSTIIRSHDIHGIYLCGMNSDSETNDMINAFMKNHKDEITRNFPFIIQKGGSKPRSPNDLLLSINADLLYSDVICGGPKIVKNFEVYPEDKVSGFQLKIGNDSLTIDHFVFSAELSVIEKKSNISSVKEYRTEDKKIAQILKFEEVEFPEGKRTPEFVLKIDEEGNQLSFRFKEPE